MPANKRKRDTTSGEPLPVKRARLARTEARQPGVEDEKAEQAVENTLQQPRPTVPSRRCASFLKDFVDPAPSPGPDHTFVFEWLESIGSDQEKRCRSDSYLRRSNDEPVPRNLARSALEMSYARDADGYVVPPTPVSTGSRSRRTSTADNYSQFSAGGASGASTPSSGVRHRMYRQNNLALNNIYVRLPHAPLPAVVSSHIEDTLYAERDSPQPSPDELKQAMHRLISLEDGCDEDQVATFLNDTIFPNPEVDSTYGPATGLMSSSGALMSQHLVPTNPISPYKVTQPKPDKLYGYSGCPNAVFTQQQMLAQAILHPRIPHYPAATSQGLRFPFFAIEFKAAGGSRGDLWVATNQCAGASSACLNAVDQLNASLLKHQSVQRVDNLSYCIAVDNNTAQLYISWKEDDLNHYLQRVDAFLLSSPEHFKSFREKVRNILDWGKDTRLGQIKDALDIILDENRKKATEHAKTRQPPSDGSTTSSGKKPKYSSSRRNSSRSNSAQAQCGGTKELYWELDEATSQYVYPEVDQQDQCQAFTSFDSAAKPASFTTSTPGFTSSFGTQKDSHGPSSSPYRPSYRQQSLVETDNYVSQDIHDGLAPFEYNYPEDNKQGQTLMSFNIAVEPPASFTMDPPTEE